MFVFGSNITFHGKYAIKWISTISYPLMAGHSKWNNIRHIKAEKDGEKAALFTRFCRKIQLAIMDGGSLDPALNSQLRNVVQEAIKQNMPMSSIQNYIKKYENKFIGLKKYRIDFRFQQKVFGIVIVYTDKLSVFKKEITSLLKKSGAILIEPTNLFKEYGLLQATIDNDRFKSNPEKLEEFATEDAIECGAEEIEINNGDIGLVNFICSTSDLQIVRKMIEKKGYNIECYENVYVPLNIVQLLPHELKAYKIFSSKLRDFSRVEDIYDNVENLEE